VLDSSKHLDYNNLYLIDRERIKMTRQEQFKEELKILLEKYDVAISTPCEKGVSGVQFYSAPEWSDIYVPVEGTGIDFICNYFDYAGE